MRTRTVILWGGVVAVIACALALAPVFGQAQRRPGDLPLAEQIARAREQAIQRFRGLRRPSRWRALLAERVGPVDFDGAPTVQAVKAVAGKLGRTLQAAPGVEGTITYRGDGTLGEFLRDGLDGRYWYLALEGEVLHLRPFVRTQVGSVSSERGLYYGEHADELEAAAGKCGAMPAYRESVHVDGAGAVTIHGRVWFIDKVVRELKVED